MTTLDAFNYTIAKAKELDSNIINVKIQKCVSSENPDMIKKYSGPNHIKPELWCCIIFSSDNSEELNRQISTLRSHLSVCGISFDTSGSCNDNDGHKYTREWQTDWSFSYDSQNVNKEWDKHSNMLEDMISSMVCN